MVYSVVEPKTNQSFVTKEAIVSVWGLVLNNASGKVWGLVFRVRKTLNLVAEFTKPPKVCTFSFIVGNIIPKSVKCLHSATKGLGLLTLGSKGLSLTLKSGLGFGGSL